MSQKFKALAHVVGPAVMLKLERRALEEKFKLANEMGVSVRKIEEQTLVKDIETAQLYDQIIKYMYTSTSRLMQGKSLLKSTQSDNLSSMAKYLGCIGISLGELARLKVIHVSGTKGKGSTCSMVESILRHHGYTTGLYTSPHLTMATERIRINGVPISKELFVRTFMRVHTMLMKVLQNVFETPVFFQYMTLVALYLFVREIEVDVLIVEVGIGGEHDCTNILPSVGVVGITSLGLEHTHVLGETIQQIAWQKAGIIKEGCTVFTASDQSREALEVIKTRARAKNALFYIAPEFIEYSWARLPLNTTKVQHLNDVRAYRVNTSLAIQLATIWMMRHHNIEFNEIVSHITKDTVVGIEEHIWPGRMHYIQFSANRHFYLDGAHTVESMHVCADWFARRSAKPYILRDPSHKVLIYNTTGTSRNVKAMLTVLAQALDFDLVLFVPNVVSTNSQVSDLKPVGGYEAQLEKCKEFLSLEVPWKTKHTLVVPTLCNAFDYLNEVYKDDNVDILVTGSVHLVGTCLVAMEEHCK